MLAMHGEYKIEVNEHIIRVLVKGAFNDVAAEALAQELVARIEAFDHAPFVILANLLEFDGGTPKVFAVSDEFNAWLNQHHMIAKALVFTSEVLIGIEKALVTSKARQNIEYFPSEAEALVWLAQQVNEFYEKLA
ncbi:hypothetical protein SAMN05216262_11382 [Colwellia chukchiensis]|uniref:SpoIIAA-like n=1 Tax=Colwellia chukchiensis TaxID=641665 RepID=A0A1H7R6K1_9GAMM|nr:hypothetical protein [Colwellia chukchiensis]SEL55157.1 hypothetical protein SAMN05216262_11382 [Colwellia chukchiensis]